jgi:hypothetical protein
LEYLYGMTISADQRPGADAQLRIDMLAGELVTLVGRLERLLRERVPTLGTRTEQGSDR